MSTRATEDGTDAPHEERPSEQSGDGAGARGSARRWVPRNWRVGPRLVAVIAIPTVVAVVLGGLRIAENVDSTLTHDHIKDMATLGRSVVTLANELGRERILSAAYIADHPDPEKRDDDLLTELQDQHGETHQARQTVLNHADAMGTHHTHLMNTRMDSMLEELEQLDTVRDEITDSRITVLPAVTKYRQMINSLVGFNQTIAETTDDSALRESVQALTALSEAREQLSYEGALMLHSLERETMSGEVREAIESSRAGYENEVQNFTNHATVEQRRVYDESFTGLEVSQMSTMRLRVMLRAEDDQEISGITQGDAANAYRDNAAIALDKMQEVESTLANTVRDQADDLRSSALNRAVIDSMVVLLVLLAVFFITSVVVRSIVRPLRALRSGAMRVATHDLPDSIVRVQEMSIPPEDVDVTPTEVGTRDEVGEVARSFDEVHRVALRLASEEAALRSNVNSMFVNLSRRSQTLVERQIRLIDGLEQTEQDPDRLADLFRLDHLATRMRRNNENLLVLSGQDNTRKWAQPVPLVDVLRGAVSEVEQYERVNVRAPSHISVLGRPVNDVIHLVAELVENATSFSSHESPVGVSAEPADDGAVRLEVTDSGIGMSPDELETINERLVEPPVIDVAVARRMGLFVVSRLAARHGIEVQLHEAHNGGITARVLLPSDLLITPVESAPSALGSTPAVPNTFAEATAAFAANPAPVEPSDGRPSVEAPASNSGSALPKRTPGENTPREHPPSGQDLWSTTGTNNSWNTRSGEGGPSPTTPGSPAVPRPTEAQESAPRHTERDRSPAWPPPKRPQVNDSVPEAPHSGEEPVAEEPPWRIGSTPEPDEPPESAWRNEQFADTSASGVPHAGSDASNEPGSPGVDSERREGYGSTAYLSRRYGSVGAGQNTVVPPTPDGSDSLPIFDAIESNWFKRRTGGPGAADSDSGSLPYLNGGSRDAAGSGSVTQSRSKPELDDSPQHRASSLPRAEEEWHSEADPGWEAAQTAAEPTAGGLTSSGLPKRVPKANLVPGAAPQQDDARQIQGRSAERVRNRFAGFQQGLRQGRDQTGAQAPEER